MHSLRPPRPTLGLVLVLGFVSGLAACSPTGHPEIVDGVVLLRWGHLEAHPAGLFSGRLSFRGGCAGVEDDSGGTQVVVWPPSARLDNSTGSLRLVIDGASFGDGEALSFGGGEYTDQAWMATLAGPIPPACRADRWVLGTDLVE